MVQIVSCGKFGNSGCIDRFQYRSRCQRCSPELRQRFAAPTQLAQLELPLLDLFRQFNTADHNVHILVSFLGTCCYARQPASATRHRASSRPPRDGTLRMHPASLWQGPSAHSSQNAHNDYLRIEMAAGEQLHNRNEVGHFSILAHAFGFAPEPDLPVHFILTSMQRANSSTLTVFVASPGDTAAEVETVRDVIVELNRLNGRTEGFRLEMIHYKTDSYSAVGPDAQAIINHQLDEYDVFLGIMKTKFGEPTPRADSGTEEEFDRALGKYFAQPTKIALMFYFGNPEVRFLDIDPAQALKMRAFRDRVQQHVKTADFLSVETLRNLLRHDLLLTARNILMAPSAPVGQLSEKRAWTTQRLADWSAETKRTTPQWSTYRTIPIGLYGRHALRLTGTLQSLSPYFRFGFKFLALTGRIFGDGSVQTNNNNVLVHLGRNTDSSWLFLTRYRNGIRLNRPHDNVLDYSDTLPLRLALAVDEDYGVTLSVEDRIVYEDFINPDIKGRLLIMAWGDQHDYAVNFTEIDLSVK
jgi:hypothetical protein